MQRFDQKGMMVFPIPEKIKAAGKMENLLVIKQCFCPNGHNLVSEQAVFDTFNGIIVKVKKSGVEGLVALNPVSVLICNRVDCHNAQIRLHNEMVHYDGYGMMFG
jgi:hypothetical protein